MAVRPVVVGVDGSASAYRAVEWAAGEAHRRGVGLRLVRAFSWTTADHPTTAGWRGTARDAGRSPAARWHGRPRRRRHPARREAESQVEIGAPIEVLELGGAAGAAAGARRPRAGGGRRARARVGRGRARRRAEPARWWSFAGNAQAPTGPVVVGVDGSPVSEAALAFAFDAAAARGVDLVAVHAWSPTAIDKELAPLVEWDAAAEEAPCWPSGWPGGGRSTRRWRCGDRGARRRRAGAGDGLRGAAGGGRSRGRGNAAGLLLGSVSHGVLHGGHCPVAVVRPGTDS